LQNSIKMSKFKEKLGRWAVLAAIPVTILASNLVKNRLNLEQNVQEINIASPDATIVDIPINYAILDINYLKMQKDSAYVAQ